MTASKMTLDQVFTIPDVVSASDFVLQLNTGVEKASQTVGEYVVTDALAVAFNEALDQLDSTVKKGTSQGIFVHGSFGSGKSHFMAVLDLILRGTPQARALPGLQATISAHQALLDKRLFTVDYHLIGATSFEDALFSGYLAAVAKQHPEARPPVLHRSDALLTDATKAMNSTPTFFDQLNAAGSDDGWGSFAGGWDERTFLDASRASVGDPERERLVSDLVATMFSGYVSAGEWLDVSDGLAAMATHAKGLGYQGLVLFLDELVLWLASHLANSEFVSAEGAKVAKLVETGKATRDLPVVSFVARQRDLADFLGDRSAGGTGAEKMAIGETFRWWEDRFDKITLQSADLPKIAHRRLLQPKTAEAQAAIHQALRAVKDNQLVWDTLLTSQESAGEVEFAEVYPFSPALVDTLVVLAPMMQRERTALKVMAQLLVNSRTGLTIDDIIPAGDLFDVVVTSGDQPLTEVIRRHFDVARRLYEDKLRPMLLDTHSLDEAQATVVDRNQPFSRDDRLVKTLLMSSLAPGVKSLSGLTASKLAALNHGTVRSRIPGNEGSIVLERVRGWAETVGEISIGEGDNPIISIELSGVDYDSILERVANEDNEGARRTLLKKILFTQLGVKEDENLYGAAAFPVIWRGSKRDIDVVFGNIRNAVELPDNTFLAQGDSWRLILDFPFDSADHSPQDDLSRMDTLRAQTESRTVAWVPSFFTAERQDDLGKLVRLEYLLGGTGSHFDEHSQQLPPEQRPIARQYLENLRTASRSRLNDVLRQAYGVATRQPSDIDVSYGEVTPLATLDSGFTPQPPVGADLGQALINLTDQMFDHQFPKHPRFEPERAEVSRAALAIVLEHVKLATEAGGRVDPVETTKRLPLKRVANPVGCGHMHENHFVFDAGTFPWRNEFTKHATSDGLTNEIPVSRMREWLDPYGLSAPLQNLLILAWALLDDKEFARHSAAVAVTSTDQVRNDLVLRDPVLPDQQAWDEARIRAATVFGVTVADLRTAANVRRLGEEVRGKAAVWKDDAVALVRQLDTHSDTLAMAAAASSRLADARTGRDLVGKLVNEQDDLVLVNAIAEAPLPVEPQSVANSLSSARGVVAALKGIQWQTLDAVAGKATSDPKAEAIISPLRAAARESQLHWPLEPALRTAASAAATYLAGLATPAPASPSPQQPTAPEQPESSADQSLKNRIDQIPLDEVKEKLSELEQAIEQAGRERGSGSTVHIEWWLE